MRQGKAFPRILEYLIKEVLYSEYIEYIKIHTKMRHHPSL